MRRFLKQGGWIGLLFGVIGLGCGLWAVSSVRLSERFAADGITIAAEVVDRHSERRRRNNGTTRTHYYVAVAYVVPGEDQARRIESSVSEDYYDDAFVGGRVDIRILPDAPDQVELEPGRLGRTAWVAGVVGAAMAGFGLWMVALVRKGIRRADRLSRDGVATVGRVIRVATRKKSVTLHWTYQPPMGALQQITTTIPAASPLADLVPGSEFPARFDPADPGNAAPADAAQAG